MAIGVAVSVLSESNLGIGQLQEGSNNMQSVIQVRTSYIAFALASKQAKWALQIRLNLVNCNCMEVIQENFELYHKI